MKKVDLILHKYCTYIPEAKAELLAEVLKAKPKALGKDQELLGVGERTAYNVALWDFEQNLRKLFGK